MIDWQTGLLFFPLLLATGALAGFLAGLLGVGGGIVIVPMLFHLLTAFGVDPVAAMPISVGSSLSTIVVTSIVSARKHYAKGGVDVDLVKRWFVPILVGVLIGALLPGWLDGEQVKTTFGIILALVSLHMLASSLWSLELFPKLPLLPVQVILALIVGGLSSLLGIGGGTLMVPLLTLFSFPIHRAVATSSVFGLLISVPATLMYMLASVETGVDLPLTTGAVNWVLFAAIVPMTILITPLGVRTAYRLNVQQLKRAFSIFLFFVGIKMALF